MVINNLLLEFAEMGKDHILNNFPSDKESLDYFMMVFSSKKSWDTDFFQYLVDTREKKMPKNLAVEYFFSFARRYPETIKFLIENEEWTKKNLFNILKYFNKCNNIQELK